MSSEANATNKYTLEHLSPVFLQDIGASNKQSYLTCLQQVVSNIQISERQYNHQKQQNILKFLAIYQEGIKRLFEQELKANNYKQVLKVKNNKMSESIKKQQSTIKVLKEKIEETERAKSKKHRQKESKKSCLLDSYFFSKSRKSVSQKKNKFSSRNSHYLASPLSYSSYTNSKMLSGYHSYFFQLETEHSKKERAQRKEIIRKQMGIGSLNVMSKGQKNKYKSRKYSDNLDYQRTMADNKGKNDNKIEEKWNQDNLFDLGIRDSKLSNQGPNLRLSDSVQTPTFQLNSALHF